MSETMKAVGKTTDPTPIHPAPNPKCYGRSDHFPPPSDIRGGVGSADALFINTIPKPEPKASDAIVKIKAFGLNRMDLYQREGHYPLPPQAPATLGVEFSGVIESFGAEPETDFRVGDEVFGLAYGGV